MTLVGGTVGQVFSSVRVRVHACMCECMCVCVSVKRLNKIMSLEDMDPHISYMAGNDFGQWDRFFLLCVCACACMHV